MVYIRLMILLARSPCVPENHQSRRNCVREKFSRTRKPPFKEDLRSREVLAYQKTTNQDGIAFVRSSRVPENYQLRRNCVRGKFSRTRKLPIKAELCSRETSVSSITISSQKTSADYSVILPNQEVSSN
jgi:hypothetical protein